MWFEKFIKIMSVLAFLWVVGLLILVARLHAEPLDFRKDQYIPPIVAPQPPKMGPEIWQAPNFGPNTQTQQPPINSPVQTIHPK